MILIRYNFSIIFSKIIIIASVTYYSMTASVGSFNVEVYMYKIVKKNTNYVKVSTQPAIETTLFNLKNSNTSFIYKF